MKHLFAPAVLLLTGALNVSAQTEPIRIDLGQKGAVVSPNLYGIFFEEISHAGDGGLYAELVQNRGFEEHVLPSGMTYRDGKAYAPDAMNYEHRNNRNWNIPWNLEEKKMTGWRVAGEKAIVTGENLGQVASQTLDNMAVIEKASDLLILRPLLTFEKLETTAIAEKIGTFNLSSQNVPDSCTIFAPDDPATSTRLNFILFEEKPLDIDGLVQQCLESAIIINPDTDTRHLLKDLPVGNRTVTI